jgi:hypothetical protein
VKATTGICKLIDYSVSKKCQHRRSCALSPLRAWAHNTLKPMHRLDVAQTRCLAHTVRTSPAQHRQGIEGSRLRKQHRVIVAQYDDGHTVSYLILRPKSNILIVCVSRNNIATHTRTDIAITEYQMSQIYDLLLHEYCLTKD